jgi:hypothetical protein
MTDTDPSARPSARLLHAATDGLDAEVDVDALVRAGTARGRTLRRRRRVGTAVGAAAALAVVTTVGVVSGAAGPQTASDDGPGPSDRVTSPVGIEPGRLAVPATEVPGTFADLLPTVEVGPVQEGPGHPFVDEPQRTAVDFLVDGTPARWEVELLAGAPTCAELAEATPDATCTRWGGIEVAYAGPTESDGVTSRSVSAWFMGYLLTATSWSAPGEGERPPLTAEQLRSVVVSDRWYLGPDDVEDVPDSAQVRARWTDLDPADVPGLLADRLPGGPVTQQQYRITDPPPTYGSAPGFGILASVQLRGAAVHLSLGGEDWEDWGTFEEYAGCDQLDCEELPDGSVLTSRVREDVQGDGHLSQVVELVRRDGGRVAVIATNAPGDSLPPVADEPVLTLEEMRGIVLDPVWLSGS